MPRKLSPRIPRRKSVRSRRVRRALPTRVTGAARFAPKNIWAAITSKKGLRIIGIGLASLFGIMALAFLWFAKDLPSPNKINAQTSAQTTKIYDRTGQHVLIEVFGDQNRSLIEFNQMPQSVKDATVALEDKNFYKQGAFSPTGIARAFTGVLFKDPSKGGGSTITQQYVKNAFLTGDRTFARKIKELILSIQIELLYKKDDILKLYLNEIPYGSTAYGIQAASKTYFGKDAKDLDLAQSALLASLPQAPSYYSPYGQHVDELLTKKNHVLDLMVEQHYISQADATTAKQEDVIGQLKPESLNPNVTAPHFVQYVRDLLEAKYGVKTVNEGGLKVITTLDVDKQKLAEESITKNMAGVRGFGGSNAALVSADPTSGEVLSMVGSYDYSNPDFGTFNVAVARRQPGSSFKPIAYSTAFKKNWGPGSTIYDVPTDFGGGYKPNNYTGRNYGVQSMRTALAGSLNIPAVKTLYLAGISDTLQTAKDLGINTLDQGADNYGLSLVLGSGDVELTEMVNAYSAFADGGQRRDPVYVLKVTDSKGKVLEETKPETNRPKQALDPQIAYLISSVLSDNSARSFIFGANNPLTLRNRPVAAKTGTTELYRDAWTIGYTPHVVTGVWAGNNNNKSMTAAAAEASAPIWNYYMSRVTANDPPDGFVKPAGIKEVTLDANTGKAPTDTTKTKRTDIFPSWYKAPTASASETATINKLDGKLATDCTPEDARQTITGGGMSAEIPSTDPSYARWEAPVAALAAKLGYGGGGNLPTEKSTMHSCSDTKPSVSLDVSPSSGSTFTLTANVSAGTFTPTTLVYYLNGNEITTQTIGGAGIYPLSNTPSSAGTIKYSVKVIDSGLYSATSDEKIVTANGGAYSLNCSGVTCTVTGSGITLVKWYMPIANFLNNDVSAPFDHAWNGSDTVKAIISGSSGGDTLTYP